ncbi:hypothetical protein ABIE27_002317 [Paenibacillus sp. 4624]
MKRTHVREARLGVPILVLPIIKMEQGNEYI